MFDVRNPRLTAMFGVDTEFVLCVKFGEFGFEVLGHEGDDLLRCLGGDQTVDAEKLLFLSLLPEKETANRMLNFPVTLAGMTVLAPDP